MPRHLSRHQYLQAADGCRLAYRSGGPADGTPVILLHGMAGRSDTWDGVAGALIAAGRKVIALDLRGHGRSARAASYPLSDFSADVTTLLDQLELAQVDLVAHSLGGFVALSVAAQQPTRVRRLLIEDAPTPPRDESDAGRNQSAPSVRRLLGSMGGHPAHAGDRVYEPLRPAHEEACPGRTKHTNTRMVGRPRSHPRTDPSARRNAKSSRRRTTAPTCPCDSPRYPAHAGWWSSHPY